MLFIILTSNAYIEEIGTFGVRLCCLIELKFVQLFLNTDVILLILNGVSIIRDSIIEIPNKSYDITLKLN